MKIEVLSSEEWADLSEDAHKLCFGEHRPSGFNTVDYALLVVDEYAKPVAYATIIEHDRYSAYMQHGGAFPESEKSIKTVRAYHMILHFLKHQYTRITTRIKNSNLSMLKLAFSGGLLVHGVDCIGGDIFLGLLWEKTSGPT